MGFSAISNSLKAHRGFADRKSLLPYPHLSPEFKNSEVQKLQLRIGNGNANRAADVSGNPPAPEKKVDSGGA